MIALNLIKDGILTIIESLPDDIKGKCGVLCSDSTKNKEAPYDTELRDNHLEKQITFMTSNHFVGVDIMDSYHLVCTQTTKYPFTLLSAEKLLQISGRSRISGGVLSESIIYDWKPSNSVNWDELETSLVEKATILSNISSLLESIREDFHALFEGPTRLTKEDILKVSQKKYLYSDEISLLRLNYEGELVPSYFNIDNILIQNYLRSSLYSSPSTLKNKLEEDGNQVSYFPPEDTDSMLEDAREIVAERLVQP